MPDPLPLSARSPAYNTRMSDTDFPPKDQAEDPSDKTVADAAKNSKDNQDLQQPPASDKSPNPRAPLARDPSGGRPAN